MRRLTISSIRRLLSAQGGSTAVEYALIAAGVSIAVVGGVSTLGTQVKTVLYDKLVALF